MAAFNCLGIPRTYPGCLNLINLELFGTYAVSMGLPETSEQGVEVMEKTSGNSYSRLVMQNGVVVGMQFVGRAKPLGQILSAIRRKDSLLRFKSIIEARPHLPHEWLKDSVANYWE